MPQKVTKLVGRGSLSFQNMIIESFLINLPLVSQSLNSLHYSSEPQDRENPF